MLARAAYWEPCRRAWRGSKSPRRFGSPAAVVEWGHRRCFVIFVLSSEQCLLLEVAIEF